MKASVQFLKVISYIYTLFMWMYIDQWSSLYIDGIPQDEEYVQISSTWFIIHTAVSLLGMLFAVACLIFNLWFRDQKYVIESFVWCVN